jgi:hypothetical protein
VRLWREAKWMDPLHTFLGLLQLFPPAFSHMLYFILLDTSVNNSDKHVTTFSRNVVWFGKIGGSGRVYGSRQRSRKLNTTIPSSMGVLYGLQYRDDFLRRKFFFRVHKIKSLFKYFKYVQYSS